MIRFIDIRNQGTGARFSFWSTSSDSFICIDGEYAWNSWIEFAEVAQGQVDLDRYRRVCPEWVDDGEEDDIQSWYSPSSKSK